MAARLATAPSFATVIGRRKADHRDCDEVAGGVLIAIFRLSPGAARLPSRARHVDGVLVLVLARAGHRRREPDRAIAGDRLCELPSRVHSAKVRSLHHGAWSGSACANAGSPFRAALALGFPRS